MITLSLPPPVLVPFRAVDPAHTLVIDTTKGRIFVELRPELAPKSVERVETLARRGTYDGLLMHRVLAGRFVQTGNPNNRDGGGTELPNLPLESYWRLKPVGAGTVHACWLRPTEPFCRPDPEGLEVLSQSQKEWTGFLGAQPWASQQPVSGGYAQGWGAYCEGVMGMGRQAAPDTGNSEFFITFRTERGLDRDYAVVGRVVVGLDQLKKVAVGEPPSTPDKMLRVRVLSDVPAPERPHVEVEDTASPEFVSRIVDIANATRGFPSVCDVPVAGRVR